MFRQPLVLKAATNHSLIDLNPPSEVKDDELASDFLKRVTISETTVLYRPHVAMNSDHSNEKQEQKDSKTQIFADARQKEEIDISKVKPRKVTEFSVKRPDDTRDVAARRVLALGDKCIIVDGENDKLKLFGSSGSYLSSTDLKDNTWGMTRVNGDRFATCGDGSKVFLWTLRGQRIIGEDERYDLDHKAHGIHYNYTYCCVIHLHVNAVTILDDQGRRVRMIVMKETLGKKVGFDIHMDNESNNMYIPCRSPNCGILCMSVEGECLWFTPLLDPSLFSITEIHGTLCVSDTAYI